MSKIFRNRHRKMGLSRKNGTDGHLTYFTFMPASNTVIDDITLLDEA